MEKIFKVKVNLKNCNTKFLDELEEGQLGYIELKYNLPPEEYAKPIFLMHLREEAEKFMQSFVDFNIEEIHTEGDLKDE